jgi:hypothetical protein
LLLAAGLCLLLAVSLAFDRRAFHRHIGPLREVAAIVALAVAAQLALNGYLYGKPSLNGERPPFLTARIIADGPGRWYLEKHCGTLKWVICAHVRNLTDDTDNFLWGADGIYQNSSDSDSTRLTEEELPFVLATFRAYPLEQISRSAGNFRGQLTAFGFEDLDASGWVLGQFGPVLPRARSSYVKSRQARNALPLDLFSSLQYWTVAASLAVMAALAPLLWRRHSPRIVGLSLVIVSAVVANALVTGTLSTIEDRYQCRVIWLVPFLAGLFVLDWLRQRQTSKRMSANQAVCEPVAAN